MIFAVLCRGTDRSEPAGVVARALGIERKHPHEIYSDGQFGRHAVHRIHTQNDGIADICLQLLREHFAQDARASPDIRAAEYVNP